MTNTYDIGDRVEISTSTPFQDSEGTALDPNVVTFKVKDPAGATTSYVYNAVGEQDAAITKNATGDYTLTIDVEQGGDWYYRIEGEQTGGENRGADEGKFNVSKSNT